MVNKILIALLIALFIINVFIFISIIKDNTPNSIIPTGWTKEDVRLSNEATYKAGVEMELKNLQSQINDLERN